MIITERVIINGNEFNRTYSSLGYFIERDGVEYAEAIELLDYTREYNETDKPIEAEATEEDYQEALRRMGVEV